MVTSGWSAVESVSGPGRPARASAHAITDGVWRVSCLRVAGVPGYLVWDAGGLRRDAPAFDSQEAAQAWVQGQRPRGRDSRGGVAR